MFRLPKARRIRRAPCATSTASNTGLKQHRYLSLSLSFFFSLSVVLRVLALVYVLVRSFFVRHKCNCAWLMCGCVNNKRARRHCTTPHNRALKRESAGVLRCVLPASLLSKRIWCPVRVWIIPWARLAQCSGMYIHGPHRPNQFCATPRKLQKHDTTDAT